MFGFGDVRPLLTRRRLLVAGLGAGVVVGVPLGGAGWGLLSAQPAAAGLRTLSVAEAATAEAIADAYFPAGNFFGVAAADVDIRTPLDAYITALYPRERRALRALLRGIEAWPRLSVGGGAFSALSVAKRVAVLRAFDDSDVTERRLLGTVLRQVCLMPMFENAAVLNAIGHRHGCELPPSDDDDVGIG